MTLIEFAIIVRDTRNAQINYFQSRSHEALRVARRHERILDLAVAKILFESGPRIDIETDHE